MSTFDDAMRALVSTLLSEVAQGQALYETGQALLKARGKVNDLGPAWEALSQEQKQFWIGTASHVAKVD